MKEEITFGTPCEICGAGMVNIRAYKTKEDNYICARCYDALKQVTIVEGKPLNY